MVWFIVWYGMIFCGVCDMTCFDLLYYCFVSCCVVLYCVVLCAVYVVRKSMLRRCKIYLFVFFSLSYFPLNFLKFSIEIDYLLTRYFLIFLSCTLPVQLLVGIEKMFIIGSDLLRID